MVWCSRGEEKGEGAEVDVEVEAEAEACDVKARRLGRADSACRHGICLADMMLKVCTRVKQSWVEKN